MDTIARVRKAIAAAVLTAATALVAAAQKGPLGTNEYIAAAVAGVVAGVTVYFVPNAPPAAAKPSA